MDSILPGYIISEYLYRLVKQEWKNIPREERRKEGRERERKTD